MPKFVPRLSTFEGFNLDNIISVLSTEQPKITRQTLKLSRVFFYSLTIHSENNLAELSNCMTCDRGMSFTTLFNSSGVTVQYCIRVEGQYKNKVKNGMDENTFPCSTSEPLSWSASQKNEVVIVCIAKQLNTYSTLNISEINHKE